MTWLDGWEHCLTTGVERPHCGTTVAVVTNRADGATASRAEDADIGGGQPCSRLGSSDGYGWTSLVARTYSCPSTVAEFSTEPTTALTVVATTHGVREVACRVDGRWRQTIHRAGSAHVAAPLTSSTMRWHAATSAPVRTVNIYLRPHLVDEVSWAMGGVGMLLPGELPNIPLLEDPYVAATANAIAVAVERHAPAAYADALARALTAHLLHVNHFRQPSDPPSPPGRTMLRTVASYLHEHLHEDVTLSDLAALTNMSRHHVLRMFKKSTGTTPHRYLVQLRLRKAACLLRTTSQSVQQVMAACGYASMGPFSAAFRREHGCSPGQFRRETG